MEIIKNMCGRLTLFTNIDEIVDQFNISNMSEIEYYPSYNIAPSQQILAIISDGQYNRAGRLRWGLIPSFSKDKLNGYKMINARAETIDEKASFKRLFERRRCVIIADSFYEWRKGSDKKVPFRIHMKNNNPFALAGLWDRWESPEGEVIHSCTIITTAPNKLMMDIHDRMPVILPKKQEKVWLDRSVVDKDLLKKILIPFDATQMVAHEVPPLVNSPHNDSYECITKK